MKGWKKGLLLGVFFLGLLGLSGWRYMAWKAAQPHFHTTYQAVFLDNGQMFFGRIDRLDSPYPRLKDVYFIQRVVDPKTKETKNVLVKRKNELFSSDWMVLNARHILSIEPVDPKSKVAELIRKNHEKP